MTSKFEPLEAAFNVEHAQRYGQSAVDEVLEVVKIRLVVTASRVDRMAESWLTEPWSPEATLPDQMRQVVFDDADRPLATRIVWRPSLPVGAEVVGPAVIEEPNSTILLHPGDQAVVSDAGHLVISVALEN